MKWKAECAINWAAINCTKKGIRYRPKVGMIENQTTSRKATLYTSLSVYTITSIPLTKQIWHKITNNCRDKILYDTVMLFSS